MAVRRDAFSATDGYPRPTWSSSRAWVTVRNSMSPLRQRELILGFTAGDPRAGATDAVP